jgi:hypothetical protein
MKLVLLITILFLFGRVNSANCLGSRSSFGCSLYKTAEICTTYSSVTSDTSASYDCQWNPATLTCSESSTPCTVACNDRIQVSNCSVGVAGTPCSYTYQNVNGDTKFCKPQPGACVASTLGCVVKPSCPTALTAVANCFGIDPSVCLQKFQWDGNAFQCYLDSNGLCVASTDSCIPPCFPPGRNPSSSGFCDVGNSDASYCITLTSTNLNSYCVWAGSSVPYSNCTYGVYCNKNLLNCPTAIQAVANCSTLTSQSNCNAGFLWNSPPVQQCMWNSVSSVCTASTVQCIPPCLPPGRSAGTCSSKTTQLTCLQTTDTTAKAYCAWTSGVCVNGLTCHT